MQDKVLKNQNLFIFTLLELMIVAAIIIILASLLFPALSKSRGLAKDSTCKNNLKQAVCAATNYTNDYNGLLPLSYSATSGKGWNKVFMDNEYISTPQYRKPSILVCPLQFPYTWTNDESTTYGMMVEYPANISTNLFKSTSQVVFGGTIRILSTTACPVFADSRVTSPTTAGQYQWYRIFKTTPMTHLRHQNKANLAFPDASVRGLNAVQLKNIGCEPLISPPDFL